MAKVTPRTLSGFMELLPADQMKMERIMQLLRENYSLYGFTPLDTPAIESSEVLLAKGGGETENGRGRSPAVFEGRRFRAPFFYAYWYCFLYFRRKRIVMIVASSSENTTEYHTP